MISTRTTPPLANAGLPVGAARPSHSRQRILESARKELEFRGEMLTPEAIAKRAQVSVDAARAYLRSTGVSTRPLPTTAHMCHFVEARAFRAQLEAARAKVLASLPAPYSAPPRPPTDLLDAKPPGVRDTYPDHVDWARGLLPGIVTGAAAGAGVGVFLHVQGAFAALALPIALVTGVLVAAVPVVFNLASNAFENRRVRKANARGAKRRAELVATFEQQQRDAAPEINAQRTALAAWEARVAAERAARADLITSAHLEPLRQVIASTKNHDLRLLAGFEIAPLVRELLGQRQNELTLGAGATLAGWNDLTRHLVNVGSGLHLGFHADHLKLEKADTPYWLSRDLDRLDSGSVSAIADAIRARYYDLDACRVPGDRETQLRTLVTLKARGGSD